MRQLLISMIPICGVICFMVGCDNSYETALEKGDDVSVQAPPPKPFEPKVAEVGVGIKGQSLQNETGVGKIIAQPAMTLFTTKEKVAFEIMIPKAMSLFQGFTGRMPESHEEFMAKIIKENQIALPKLPPGQVYRYHPDDAQLWVEPETTE